MFRKSINRITISEGGGQYQHEIGDIGYMVDHISSLPDCILHHILAFMPTVEAVKTSILSTRWKNLWASAPNIDIDDDKMLRSREVDVRLWRDVTFFVKFVESVLRLRDASNMKKFHLSCYVFHGESQVHSWISYAIMHNVQELDLNLCGSGPCVIPRSLFESTSLVSLKIRIDCAIQLPSHVSFPCLKTLHLSSVQFSDVDFIEKLFSGCPVLEELALLDCAWINLNNIAISSSTLKSLTIREHSRFMIFDYPTRGCKVNIDAPNVTYFEYIGYLKNYISLSNTSSLDKSFIDISPPDVRLNEVASRAIDLLNQLQKVVSLRLSNDTLKTFSFAASIRFAVLPNLTHLMLTMEIGANRTFRVLMCLLSCCPVLQSICFSEGLMCDLDLGGNNPIWSSIPICFSNSLKTVTLKNFYANDSEICFLKCVLKDACVLERMDIGWSKIYLRDLKRKTKMMKKLENFERSSAACVIKFS